MSNKNKGWAPHLVSRVEEIDIDPDIEKEIAQLQEAKLSEKIKEIKLVEEKKEPTLADDLGSFFNAISEAKTDLNEKIKKDEVKIEGLEELFNELASEKKKKVKKKKVLLVEPEKTPTRPQEDDSGWVEEYKTEQVVSELEELAGEETIEEAVSDKTVDKMIEKVKKQISSMKNANELDKERINQLESLDSWEKLKEEFLNFKHTVNVQLGTVGGGGLDPHNINSDFLPSQTNTYNLGSAQRRWKDIFLSAESIDLAGATISSDGTGAISIAATGATLPTGSKTEDGNALAVMGTDSTGAITKPIRRVNFFSAAGGLSTANASFEFAAEVPDRYAFTDSNTFTLANGNNLTDSGITLFQL